MKIDFEDLPELETDCFDCWQYENENKKCPCVDLKKPSRFGLAILALMKKYKDYPIDHPDLWLE